MTESNTNQRMPPLSDPGQYPYVGFEQFRDGSWTRQVVYPDYESYARGHMLGSWYEHDVNGAHKNHSVADSWSYTTKGHTETVQSNHDSKIGGSSTKYVTNDEYSEHGQDWMKAISGSTIHASGGTNFTHATQGHQMSSTGDFVTDHNDGNHHINIEGDHIQFTGNNKYDSIGGEYGVFVSNGNMDINVNQKLNLQSKKSFSLQSNTTITISVGNSSVVVNTNSITIVDTNKNMIQMNENGIYIQQAPSANLYLGGNSSTIGWQPVELSGGPASRIFGNPS